MAEESAPATGDVTSFVSEVEQVVDRFVKGLEARVAAVRGIGGDAEAFHASLSAGGTTLDVLLFKIVLVVAVTAGAYLLFRLWFGKAHPGALRRFLSPIVAAGLAIIVGLVVQRFLPAEGLAVRTLRIWIILTGFSLMAFAGVHGLLTRSPLGKGHLGKLARDLSIAIGWSMFGIATMSTLRLWNAGPGLRDVLGSLLFILPAFGIFGWIVWRHRSTLSGAIAGTKPRGFIHGWLARIWPGVVIGFLLVTFVMVQIAQIMKVPLSAGTVLLTVVIVFLVPHLDALIANRAHRALEARRVSILAVALEQTSRFAVLILMLTMLGAIWASPLASGFGIELQSVRMEAIHIALIATGAAFLWSLLGAGLGRIAQRDHQEPGHVGPRSRLGTLVPLIGWVGKAAIVSLAFLSVLVSLGVNVWPLITGLSVFGLAIGFGSQTLVKDIVSGLFFLVDDAFRIGEYVETSGAKGTVEKISVRSVTLRNPRGPVATVPYGQISKVVNFSRDYAIDKIQFRVAFDTDVELVRKLFKKIGLELLENPEISGDIIEPFKSQGIFNVEDGTVVVRGKFVARPGRQTVVRRHVMKAVHQAFRENGIRSVPKPLTGDPVSA